MIKQVWIYYYTTHHELQQIQQGSDLTG